MQIFSKLLGRDELESIADAMGIELYMYDYQGVRKAGKFSQHHAHKLVLRPGPNDRWRKANRYFESVKRRRAWAVSWAGHYVFMRAVLEIDNNAIIISKAIQLRWDGSWGSRYEGLGDFHAYAWETGQTNIGSIMYPDVFVDAQADAHVKWDDEDDLIQMAKGVVNAIAEGKAGRGLATLTINEIRGTGIYAGQDEEVYV